MPDVDGDLSNARLYPGYVALLNAFFWMPVFFLYFSDHVYQPYARLLGIGSFAGLDATPLVTGLLAAAVGVVGSFVAGRSARIARCIGFRRAMLAGMGLQTAIIGLLGLVLHPVMLLPVVMRSVPRALMTAPMNAVIAPAVARWPVLSHLLMVSAAVGLGALLAAALTSRLAAPPAAPG